MAKTLTTNLRYIDVRRLARDKLLVPGYLYGWQWKHHRTAEVQASIQLEVGDEYITSATRSATERRSATLPSKCSW